MKTIPIGYCGQKPSKTDTTYETGLTWTKDDVHEVPVEKAALLLNHPDVWFDARTEKAQAKAPVEPVSPKSRGPLEEAEDPAAVPTPMHLIDTIEKAATFAKQNFNIDLDQSLTIDEARAEIQKHMDRKRFEV